MIRIINMKFSIFCSLLLSLLLFSSCSSKAVNSYYLVVGKKASVVEQTTAEDLKTDLQKVLDREVVVISETDVLPDKGVFYILGTPGSSTMIATLAANNEIALTTTNPGPRGGLWHRTTLDTGQQAIVLAGSDVQGLQYAVYDYAEDILGIDPLEYWTDKHPESKTKDQLLNFENKIIAPPAVPILCYFENDVDELANYRGKLLEYDWESYTQMINSLVRLRYNAIQLFDMLGRPEFFIRPEYKVLSPDYQVDIDYVEKMIDYAQKKGMKVAIDFALGYQIHPMSADKATCWKEYKEDWLDAWRYYLEKTPLGKTDIFILRPRHQVWDWEYESSCGEDKITVFNEVYKAFGDLVDEYKPKADKVLVCYSDGMQMWNDGFRPPKDWIVAWSDHGFGEFEYLPNTTDGYNFGTYMHAGFWLNHTVHNPYPEKVETVMKSMFKEYDANKFCLVNGQNFRPFILNIEAYSAVCNNPETFDGDLYYKQWTERYFKPTVAQHAVKAMKMLHQAQPERIGYVQHLWEIREAVAYLSNSPIERPGKTPVAYEYGRVENDLDHVKSIENSIQEALQEAQKGLDSQEMKGDFYFDYIYLPILLYSDLITFERSLHQMALLKKQYEETKERHFIDQALQLLPRAKKQLEIIYQHRERGDRNPKWTRWYSPEIRRPNNGFPTFEMLESIAANFKKH